MYISTLYNEKRYQQTAVLTCDGKAEQFLLKILKKGTIQKIIYYIARRVTAPRLLTPKQLEYDCMDCNNRSYGIGFFDKGHSQVAPSQDFA